MKPNRSNHSSSVREARGGGGGKGRILYSIPRFIGNYYRCTTLWQNGKFSTIFMLLGDFFKSKTNAIDAANLNSEAKIH